MLLCIIGWDYHGSTIHFAVSNYKWCSWLARLSRTGCVEGVLNYVHYVAGGGLGDVARELLYHGALGILKRWKLRNPQAHLRVCTMSHNPAHVDFFTGQTWIDELVPCRFPLELGWKPEMFYEWHPEQLKDRTELRFVLNERKSLYRVDLQQQRLKPVPVINLPPVGMAADIELTAHERQQADHWAGSLVVHPFGGERHKWFPTALLQDIVAAAGDRALVVAADYERDGHSDELAAAAAAGIRARTFAPRVLLEILRRSRAVVGAESSVYYMSAMAGRPVAMLWPKSGTYDLVQQGVSNWAWYLGEGESQNLFMPLPPLMTEEHRHVLLDWVKSRVS